MVFYSHCITAMYLQRNTDHTYMCCRIFYLWDSRPVLVVVCFDVERSNTISLYLAELDVIIHDDLAMCLLTSSRTTIILSSNILIHPIVGERDLIVWYILADRKPIISGSLNSSIIIDLYSR